MLWTNRGANSRESKRHDIGPRRSRQRNVQLTRSNSTAGRPQRTALPAVTCQPSKDPIVSNSPTTINHLHTRSSLASFRTFWRSSHSFLLTGTQPRTALPSPKGNTSRYLTVEKRDIAYIGGQRQTRVFPNLPEAGINDLS